MFGKLEKEKMAMREMQIVTAVKKMNQIEKFRKPTMCESFTEPKSAIAFKN
jgi:hypothetical protein